MISHSFIQHSKRTRGFADTDGARCVSHPSSPMRGTGARLIIPTWHLHRFALLNECKSVFEALQHHMASGEFGDVPGVSPLISMCESTSGSNALSPRGPLREFSPSCSTWSALISSSFHISPLHYCGISQLPVQDPATSSSRFLLPS